MRFQFKDKTYSLEFKRTFKPVDAIGKNALPRERMKATQLSRFPYTTVTIYEVVDGLKGKEWPVLVEAEVGCLVGADTFTLEGGRLYALKKLTKNMNKEFKQVVWETYINRPRATKTTKKQLRSLLDHTIKALKVTQDQLVAAQAQIVSLRKDEGSY